MFHRVTSLSANFAALALRNSATVGTRSGCTNGKSIRSLQHKKLSAVPMFGKGLLVPYPRNLRQIDEDFIAHFGRGLAGRSTRG